MPDKYDCSNRERKKESGKKNKEKAIYSSKHVRQAESRLLKEKTNTCRKNHKLF